ncbi:MAG: hypothetical protein FJY56_19415 [Betaproteobacteria bacterium]|nr:hypothetical protein [Betaproteobacteria bacterium]
MRWDESLNIMHQNKRYPLLFQFMGWVLLIAASNTAAVGADLTRAYLNAYQSDCAFGAAHVKALRAHGVLMVPGYLGALYPQAYAEHMHWLKSIGVDHQKIAVTSGDSVEVNAGIIAGAIRAAAKPVILISHSKGSVGTLHALLAEPSLRAKVRGWISLQGAFLGSPVADRLLDGSLLNPFFANLMLGFFGGTRESARALTTTASAAYYKKHAAAISQLLREVPVLAFASALDAKPGAQPATSLEIPYELMAREGIRNDGMIPLEAAVLPGVDFVKVSGVDHIAPIMPARLNFDRVRMTQALLLALRSPLRELPRDADCKARP